MRLIALRVQDFRNLSLVRLEFKRAKVFLLGPNAQGKTNLLEAAGLVGALRSFRGIESRELIRHGAAEARVWLALEHEREGAVEVEILVRPTARQVTINGTRCLNLTEYLGRFPVVALSSQDLQLLRGAPQARRRALDLAIAALDDAYLFALTRYQKALNQRNALLRGPKQATPQELTAFEAQMAPEAAIIVEKRRTAGAELAGHLAVAYDQMAGAAIETPDLRYKPDAQPTHAEGWQALWAESRPRDAMMKMTLRGPHRDDFAFDLGGHGAKSFGSEGQQRALVVAFRLAQAQWQMARTGLAPIVLADDVLGELDTERRAGFWRAAGAVGQVIATGTHLPGEDSTEWEVWKVKAGTFER